MEPIILQQQTPGEVADHLEAALTHFPGNTIISLTDLAENQITLCGGSETDNKLALTIKELARALFDRRKERGKEQTEPQAELSSWLQRLFIRLHKILTNEQPVPPVDDPAQLADYLDQMGSITSILFRYSGKSVGLKRMENNNSVMLLSSTLQQSGQFITHTGHLQHLMRLIRPDSMNRALDWVVQLSAEVDFAALIDTTGKGLVETSSRNSDTEILFDEQLCKDISAMFNNHLQSAGRLRVKTENGIKTAIASEMQIETSLRTFYCAKIPFLPDMILIMIKPKSANPIPDWQQLHTTMNHILRDHIGQQLAQGLRTITMPFPKTQKEFIAIIEQLRQLNEGDLISRLLIGGFLDHPMQIEDIEQRCQECIYYLPHRKWCDLPELPLPVEPHWWCRLWKL